MSSEKQVEKDISLKANDPKESCQAMLQQLTGDLQIIPMLRTSLQRNWNDTLLSTLDTYIKDKDTAIHEICDKSYLQFGSSLDGVSDIREQIDSLKGNISDFHADISESTKRTLNVAEQYMNYRKLQNNLNEATKSIDIFENLLQMAERSEQQLADNKYFPALKTLNVLRTYLRDIPNCKLSRNIQAYIQPQIEKVLSAVDSSFEEWAERIGVISVPIGQTLFRKTAEKMEDKNILESNINEKSENVLVSASVDELMEGVDVSTVYQCLHVYEYMNKFDNFITVYKNARLEQANFDYLASHSLTTMDTDLFLAVLQNLLEKSISFYVIEEIIQRGSTPILSSQEIKLLFDKNLTSLIEAINYHLENITDLEQLVTLESNLWTYGLCMSQPPYNMNVNAIFDLKNRLFDLALHNIKKKAFEEIDSIVSKEDYGSYICNTQEDYETNVLRFGLIKEMAQSSFPLTMDFTSTVPNTLIVVNKYLTILLSFAKSISIYDIEKELFELCRSLLRHIREVTDKSEITDEIQPLQLGYHSINSGYFATASKHFKNIIISMVTPLSELNEKEQNKNNAMSTTSSTSQSSSASTEKSETVLNFEDVSREFMQIQGKMQGTLFEQIINRSDEFLSEYTTMEYLCTVPNNKPHQNVSSLINYLTVIFSLLSFLPSSIRDAAHFTACKNISNKISELFYEYDIQFNAVDIFNLNLDLSSLETFAESCDVSELIECFKELRQLINYLLSGDLKQVLNNEYYVTNMTTLSFSNVYTVLRKCKELKKAQINKKNSMITNFKKKDVEYVLTQLSNLIDM